MAKKLEQKAKPSGNGHNRVQGFVFGINLEGSQDVMMEGIKVFTTAMSKSSTTFAPVVTRPTLEGKQTAAVATTGVVEAEEPETAVEEVPEEGSTFEDEETPSNGGSPKPGVKRIPKTPVVLNDIDFNAGKVSLKNFVTQKKSDRHLREVCRDHGLVQREPQLGRGQSGSDLHRVQVPRLDSAR